jgi:hypothetical protein
MPTDSFKSPIRFSGAVYTPPKIALEVVSLVKKLFPSKSMRILEPSVGDGSFYNELVGIYKDNIESLVVVDIDEAAISSLKDDDLSKSKTTYLVEDFISFASCQIKSEAEKFDLVIGIRLLYVNITSLITSRSG